MVFNRRFSRFQPAPAVPDATQTSPSEPSRIVGYHNAVDIDSSASGDGNLAPLPSYEHAASTAAFSRPLRVTPQYRGSDTLPAYKCTVEKENAISVKFEKSNVFESAQSAEWTDAFVRLEGTILSIYQLQTGRRFGRILGSPRPDRPGRLIKRYTLQHAEVGVASDMPKHELVPRTLASSMWPPQKIKRMQQEAPHLFDHVRQYIIRIRVECDQLLLRLKSWEDRAAWIDHLCMAIDIAPPLDERTEPKYHTLPRRRRNRTFQSAENNPLTTSSLIEEQERIIRDRFPHLLSVSNDEPGVTEVEENAEENTVDPEADDLDQSVLMRDQPTQVENLNSTGSSLQRLGGIVETNPAVATENGSYLPPTANRLPANQKPGPASQLDRSQELRCRRRCMPSLLYSSRRSNDIVIRDGIRWQIDWNAKNLKPYPDLPPDYGPLNSIGVHDTNRTSIHSFGSEQEFGTMQSSNVADDSSDGSLNLPETHINPRPRSTVKSWRNVRPWSICMRKAERPGEGLESGVTLDFGEGMLLNKLRREDSGPAFQETMRVVGI